MTHPYISTGLRENKFGVTVEEALQRLPARARAGACASRRPGLPYRLATDGDQPLYRRTAPPACPGRPLAEGNINIRHLDLGGGLGVRYRDETPPSIASISALSGEVLGERDVQLLFEPGRSIAANAGLLVMQVEYLKPTPEHNFALVDAAMNDMIRPALYQAWLDIQPVQQRRQRSTRRWDVVGPVCETGDFLGKDRELSLSQGDLLAMFGAGAYGFTMSSNYNSRGRAPEIMVDGDRVHLVRERETIADIMRGETACRSRKQR